MSDEGYLIHRDSVPRIFRAVRAVEDGTGLPPAPRRRVLSEDGGLLLVKTIGLHKKGEVKECIVMVGPQGEEEESDSRVACLNHFSDLQNAKAIAGYVLNGYALIAASCDDSEEEEDEEPEDEDSEGEDEEGEE